MPAILNGDSPAYVDPGRRENFYERLLKLHSEILAGQHARLKISNGVKPLETTRHAPPNALPPQNADGIDHGHAPSAAVTASKDQDVQKGGNRLSDATTTHSLQKPHAKPLHNISCKDDERDAVLQERLTIERKLTGTPKKSQWVSVMEADIDIGDILRRAHERVPPISGIESPKRASAQSDSFDEYYSSKADSWSSDKSEASKPGPDTEAVVISGSSEGEVSEAGEYEPLPILPQPTEPVHEPPASTYKVCEPISDHLSHEETHPVAPWAMHTCRPQDQPPEDDTNLDADVSGEDSDYSPPAPAARPEELESRSSGLHGGPLPHNTLSHMPGLDPANLQQFLAAAAAVNGPIVGVNQINSPAAPQPAHISRLAQNGDGGSSTHGQTSSHEQAPKSNGASRKDRRGKQSKRISPRNQTKKRRRPEQEDYGRKPSTKRVARSPARQSPEPFIKEEPRTPPLPLDVSYQDYGRTSPSTGRGNYYSDVEISERDPRHAYAASEQLRDIADVSHVHDGRPGPPRRIYEPDAHVHAVDARDLPSSNIPPGYALVPIEEARPYEQSQGYLYPAQPKPSQPVFVDRYGVEYYTQPPQPPVYRTSVARHPPPADIRFSRSATLDPRYHAATNIEPHYAEEENYHPMPPPPVPAGGPSRAYSLRPVVIPQHVQEEQPYRRETRASSRHEEPQYAPRSYSVRPPMTSAEYAQVPRYSSAAPPRDHGMREMAPPPPPQRPVSVRTRDFQNRHSRHSSGLGGLSKGRAGLGPAHGEDNIQDPRRFSSKF